MISSTACITSGRWRKVGLEEEGALELERQTPISWDTKAEDQTAWTEKAEQTTLWA